MFIYLRNYTFLFIFLLSIFLLNFFSIAPLYSQQPSFRNSIHIKLWAPLDAYPGIEKQDGDQFQNAVDRIKEIAPFILDGMVYGWKFDYTPVDKARGVKEYFEVETIKSFSETKERPSFSSPLVEEPNLTVWADFARSEGQKQYFDHWSSLSHPQVKGHGVGEQKKGFEGIKDAYKTAILDAVYNYVHARLKNKPKEVTGRVLLFREPRMYVSAGQYNIDLDFFLEVDKIVVYSTF